MDILIRLAESEDYDRLLEVYRQVDALHRQHLPKIFQESDGPSRTFKYYCSILDEDKAGLFVAGVAGNLVGFIHVIIRDSVPIPILRPRRYAVIDGIGVKTAFQNRGVGKALMEEAHAWLAAMGAASIQLNVYAFNENAYAFYNKLGYRTLSRKMSRDLSLENAGPAE